MRAPDQPPGGSKPQGACQDIGFLQEIRCPIVQDGRASSKAGPVFLRTHRLPQAIASVARRRIHSAIDGALCR